MADVYYFPTLNDQPLNTAHASECHRFDARHLDSRLPLNMNEDFSINQPHQSYFPPQQQQQQPSQQGSASTSSADMHFQSFSDDFFLDSFGFEQLMPAAPIVPAATTVNPGQLSAPFHYQQEPDYYVQRHVPSTRSYGYHPYGARSYYAQQHSYHHHVDYSQPALYDYSTNYTSLTVQPAQLCADPHSFEAHRTYNPSSTTTSQQEYTSLISEPASPVSPYQSSKDDSDPLSSPSSAGLSSSEVSIASASVSPKMIAPQQSRWSSLPSPTESNQDSDKEDELPAVKKRPVAKSRRATRSAPEPAWVEAVLAEDPLKQRVKNANRPIAFACVFCRHRKIQCIRPKMDLAPGERPAPCNQCEKRSRTCEYPPAVLNPKTTRRVKVSAKNDD